VVLKEGRLFREGPLEKVFDRETLEQVYGMKVVVERSPGRQSIVLPRPADGGA
jgi:ABC-type hemin transport system ATPase subunit